MKIYAPNYYKSFKCIADRCQHSCCKGWDVYLDDDTLKEYRMLRGNIGKQIRSHLKEKDDGICFEMQENGHCPFLDQSGLCRIIIEKGESYISEICREHPRFYNCFSDRYEVGLGLSCEESARIILSQTDKTEFEIISVDEESENELWDDEIYIFETRSRIFEALQNDKLSICDTIKSIISVSKAKMPCKSAEEWIDLLLEMEQLDPEWGEMLNCVKSRVKISNKSPLYAENSDKSSFTPPPSQDCSIFCDCCSPLLNSYQQSELLCEDDPSSSFLPNPPLGRQFCGKSAAVSPLNAKSAQYSSTFAPPSSRTRFKKLLLYFIYRHVSASDSEGDLAKRVSFAIFSAEMIFFLWASLDKPFSFESLCNIARLYSAEIEYSEENTLALINMMPY